MAISKKGGDLIDRRHWILKDFLLAMPSQCREKLRDLVEAPLHRHSRACHLSIEMKLILGEMHTSEEE